MNELIRKIATQAEEYAEGCYDKFRETPMFNTTRDTKFAELIVEECLTFIRPTSYFHAYPDNMIGGQDGVRLLETITNQIEEHFGVEE